MFRRLLLIPALVSTLFLTACGPGNNLADFVGGVTNIAKLATTSIVNPVDAVDIYRAKNVYAGTLTLADEWGANCFSAPYATLMKNPATKFLCENRRPRQRAIKAAKDKASKAMIRAQAFVQDHPTLNAAAVLSEAWDAVKEFRSLVPGAPAP